MPEELWVLIVLMRNFNSALLWKNSSFQGNGELGTTVRRPRGWLLGATGMKEIWSRIQGNGVEMGGLVDRTQIPALSNNSLKRTWPFRVDTQPRYLWRGNISTKCTDTSLRETLYLLWERFLASPTASASPNLSRKGRGFSENVTKWPDNKALGCSTLCITGWRVPKVTRRKEFTLIYHF